jgi:hypothetical protein
MARFGSGGGVGFSAGGFTSIPAAGNNPNDPGRASTGGGSGGGGSSGGTRIDTAAIARAEEAARQKAAAETARRIEEAKKAEAEKQRIINLQKAIVAQGAQEQTRILRNQENQRIQETITTIKKIENGKPTDVTIQQRVNLDTGETISRAYEKGGVGQRKSLTGTVTSGALAALTTVQKATQASLKQLETVMPSGVRFLYDPRGVIYGIVDKNKGFQTDISNISNYVSQDKLKKAGLLRTSGRIDITLPNGKTVDISSTGKTIVSSTITGKDNKYYYNGKQVSKQKFYSIKEPTRYAKVVSSTKSVLSPILKAFKPSIRRAETAAQRQKYYDLYNLKGNQRNYTVLLDRIRKGGTSVKLQQYALQDLNADLLNPNTAIRAEAALIMATIAGGPLIGAAVGTVYKTPQALFKAQGVEGNFQNLTWKQIAKTSGWEFGKNAAEAYAMMKLFGIGTKILSKSPKVFGFIANKITPNSAVLRRSGLLAKKGFRVALKKGLDVAGAKYLSSIGTDTAVTFSKVKQKKYKAATVGASKLAGALVGFYGEKAVKSALRKVLLVEDPRLIITKGTKSKPFAIEHRDITVARLKAAQKLLPKGKKLKVKFAKASPVREPRKSKIVTPEKRSARGVKINTGGVGAAYGTASVGKDVYLVPRTFLRLRRGKINKATGKRGWGNIPKTYWKRWVSEATKKGWIKTFKQLGLPKTYKPTIYKGSGEYLPIKKGESLKAYYARGQRLANKLKKVQVLLAPKTVLKSTQPEMEIKAIYPNPKGVKASVTRVKVGKDAFGNTIIIETVAPKSVLARIKFKIKARVEFKKESLKYLTRTEAKIAKRLVPRILQNYDFIYKSKAKGAADARKHMLQVEKNFRKILKQYGIKATDAEIKAVSRLHDILKLRGINVKDEPIIRKALLEGYLNKIPLVKKLNARQLKRVADTIGFHQDVNPKTLKGLRMNKFTRAFINADRLDIVRTGQKVNMKLLFDLKAKTVPQKIRSQFNKLTKLQGTRKWTPTIRKRYNALIRKYPGLKTAEAKIIAANKAKWKKMTPKQKAKIRAQEREYTDYLEARKKYRNSKTSKKRVIPYRTAKYNTYKTPKYKSAYRAGFSAGYKKSPTPNTKYRSTYGSSSTAYKDGYKTGRNTYKTTTPTKTKTPRSKYPGKYTYKTTTTKKKTTSGALIIPKGFSKKKLTKSAPVYYVMMRRQGKIVKLNARPLTLKDSRDYLAYRLDNSLARSAWFVPLGTSANVIRLPVNMRNYYSKVSKKLRPYKIRMGKKKAIFRGYIEYAKYSLDSKNEKRQIKVARKVTKRRTVKRKPSKTANKRYIKKRIVKKPSQPKAKRTKRKVTKRVLPKRKSRTALKKSSRKKVVKRKKKVVKKRTTKKK